MHAQKNIKEVINVLGVEVPKYVNYKGASNVVIEGVTSNVVVRENLPVNNKVNALEIDISGVIGWYPLWADAFEAMLRNNNDDVIILNISSPGGYVDDALQMHDALRHTGKKIIAFYYGNPASAATILGSAADKAYISQNSDFLAHRAWSASYGNTTDHGDSSYNLQLADNKIVGVYLAKAKRAGNKTTAEQFAKLIADEKYSNAEEVVELGLADEVYNPSNKLNILESISSGENATPEIDEAVEETESIINNKSEKMADKTEELTLKGDDVGVWNGFMKFIKNIGKNHADDDDEPDEEELETPEPEEPETEDDSDNETLEEIEAETKEIEAKLKLTNAKAKRKAAKEKLEKAKKQPAGKAVTVETKPANCSCSGDPENADNPFQAVDDAAGVPNNLTN